MGRNNRSYTEEQIIDFETVKFNIKMNIAIARRLAKISCKDAAPKLGLEYESLRRIESSKMGAGPSLEVFCGAVKLYGQKADFYFIHWEENLKLLDNIEKEEND